MKRLSLLIPFVIAIITSSAQIVTVPLSDGEMTKGKLDLPPGKDITEVVVFVPGTGPNTFLNHRKVGQYEFDYYSLFSEQFTKRGIAFFTYNRRGVDTTAKSPFEKINMEEFRLYLPNNEKKDVASIVSFLRKDGRLKNAKVTLLGWSEGTIIASMVAAEKKNRIDALILAGYVNDRMDDVIKWQFSGASSMKNVAKYFDTDSSGTITRSEFEASNKRAVFGREQLLANARFKSLDSNLDSIISREDFGKMAEPAYQKLMHAFDNHEDDWIWKNYFHVTSAWYEAHKQIEANKVRLLSIKIPIYIVHGEDDANTSVDGARAIRDSFEKLRKKNLQVFIFRGHDHNLNFNEWVAQKRISPGLSKIFQIAEELK